VSDGYIEAVHEAAHEYKAQESKNAENMCIIAIAISLIVAVIVARLQRRKNKRESRPEEAKKGLGAVARALLGDVVIGVVQVVIGVVIIIALIGILFNSSVSGWMWVLALAGLALIADKAWDEWGK